MEVKGYSTIDFVRIKCERDSWGHEINAVSPSPVAPQSLYSESQHWRESWQDNHRTALFEREFCYFWFFINCLFVFTVLTNWIRTDIGEISV